MDNHIVTSQIGDVNSSCVPLVIPTNSDIDMYVTS